ncbi:DEAD/DEAH box helicase [Bacillus sp. 03113]|uniref:DEAD/DEAH box helicase n=1 Tax=Bacillus sp. 03113 TaxID=2578211 RepID=UPI00114207C9|nr:DEAD/DEAH box helicase [Bacillus sp. 03113]
MRFAKIKGKICPEVLLHESNYSLSTNSIPSQPISSFSTIPEIPLQSTNNFNSELQKMLTGRQLLLEELPFLLQEIHEHYEKGYVSYRKGIEFKGKKIKCVRCGNETTHLFAHFPCARCRESACFYCRHCIMMGRVSACTPLISWNGPPPRLDLPSSPFVWEGTLSEGQRTASSRVVEAVNNNQELLVWAVCGAGKTEVLFKGIESALQQQKRVCLATPRTDVVLELTPRLKAAFPHLPVASLYGGSDDRHLYAPLTITTTHQLLRFYKAFDTIILDEVDAFPYSVEESLQHAVKQARKPVSSLIYLTATPNQRWQKECRSGKRAYVTIPARFHRHPLPVPTFTWCGNWEKKLQKSNLPSAILKWVRSHLNEQKQALLFLPNIELMNKALTELKALDQKIEAVHAEDPLRKEKVQRMRNKETPILLTTTILERGVTFPNIDVAVFGAEDDIFTESALVQIAGRVGRSREFPTGSILFFHYGKTEEMVRAKNQIIRMNNEARKKGMIDH